MCWDEHTSVVTFVIGTVFNIFNVWYFRDTTITIISLMWQWVLLMQLFEAIAWKNQNNPIKNKWAANGALIANVTQPIFVALALIAFTNVSTQNKVLAMVLVFLYIVWLIYALNQNKPFNELKPSESCDHLDLVWWKKFPGGASVYLIVLLCVLVLLLRPKKLMLFETGFIFVTLAISAVFYSCGTGSMWCWFAAFAPIATGLYWNYVTTK